MMEGEWIHERLMSITLAVVMVSIPVIPPLTCSIIIGCVRLSFCPIIATIAFEALLQRGDDRTG
jgi:hypothetical protein